MMFDIVDIILDRGLHREKGGKIGPKNATVSFLRDDIFMS